jgi:hypothetical protein
VRVYLPCTEALLREWAAAGSAPPGPGFAVTPGLREWYSDGDTEELELTATVLAGRGSLRLADQARPRRIVVAVEVGYSEVFVPSDPDQQEGSVQLTVPAGRSTWQAVMADDVDEDTRALVGRAAAAIGDADAGDEDAELAVGDVDELDLLWWGVQEIEELLR